MEAEVANTTAAILPILFKVLGASNPIVQILSLIPTIIGGASLVVKGASTIAKITPNTKDDEFVSKGAKAVSKVVSVLDKLALNPDTLDARSPSWNKRNK